MYELIIFFTNLSLHPNLFKNFPNQQLLEYWTPNLLLGDCNTQ